MDSINGQSDSGIFLNGSLLNSPYVIYPIDLDTDGGLSGRIILAESYISFPGGTVAVQVVDDSGRTGTGNWSVQAPNITLSPTESGPGSQVAITGAGFLAANRSVTQCSKVDIA